MEGICSRAFDFFNDAEITIAPWKASTSTSLMASSMEVLDLVPRFEGRQYSVLGWVVNTFKKSDNDPRATGAMRKLLDSNCPKQKPGHFLDLDVKAEGVVRYHTLPQEMS